VVAILGQGPIGLIFTMLVKLSGARILATDLSGYRRQLALEFGAEAAFDPRTGEMEEYARNITSGRGADVVLVAASAPGIVEQAIRCSRPGSRILLFAQTSNEEQIHLSGAAICKDERVLFGSYSASVDLQAESARLVFSGELPCERLISHKFPLPGIREGIELALHPTPESLKIVVQPQRWP
jgi:L-iditol 2-dehydrogenase